MAAGKELRQLESEYLSLVAKNSELEGACAKVEAQAALQGETAPENGQA